MRRKSKINKSAIVIISLAFIWLLFNESGIIKWYHLKTEQSRLIQSINELYNDQSLIESHIDQLTNDYDYLEFIAYSRFKMVKPGEKIFRVKDHKAVSK
tara:strand:+ start:6204 stop:6500 length:297 start_codon:yes stop_codon:yes gene_type:complete